MATKQIQRIPQHRHRGFTLVETLIVIVIIAALATLAFPLLKRASESAYMASNNQNLRQLGVIIKTLQDDNGAMPLGYNWATGASWATLVVEQQTKGTAQQDTMLLAPTVYRSIPPQLKHETISNYAVNPIIFPDNNAEGGSATLKYRVTDLRLLRPHEQILLGDALPRSRKAAQESYGHSTIVWWGLRGAVTGNTWSNPPVANQAMSNRAVNLPSGIANRKVDAEGLPGFRNRGKCHFLFADGHVESIAPSGLKHKHFAISY